ncbi:hypothetical protein [Frigoribacterium sp. 9N]|uniref:hypothetical protein n=1 Tax=Frigoribacterium sp. 9N TaxID=2653144 RepID=UPI0012F0378C|nr:hypothetical protein [Frigoribacterium sp. 9N]VXB73094.1 hypothetical protein FRIGORI9N_400134 [Frigoribacterium sp. 9N]
MNVHATAEELGELLAPLTWVKVDHALLPEPVDIEVVAFASSLTGRRYAFLERDATWVIVEPLDDDGNALETATGIASSAVPHLLALHYALDEATRLASAFALSGSLNDALNRARYLFVSLPWTLAQNHPEHEAVSIEAAKATWRLNDLLGDEAPVGAPRGVEGRA